MVWLMRLNYVSSMPQNYSRNCMPRRKKLTNKWDLIKIKVLEDEIEYFKSCIQEHDTGHIYTTIDALETRVKLLKGIETDDPFLHHRTDPNLI